MKSNIIEQEQQLTQTFVKASANIVKINQCQELSNYLYQTACKVSSLVNCSQLLIIISQENTEQIIASNLATYKASRYKNIISKTIKYVRQKREYKKVFDNYIYIPLETATGEIVGGVCALGKQLLSYTREEILTLEMFAELTATKLENYRLSQQHQKMNSMIQTQIVNHTKKIKCYQS